MLPGTGLAMLSDFLPCLMWHSWHVQALAPGWWVHRRGAQVVLLLTVDPCVWLLGWGKRGFSAGFGALSYRYRNKYVP